MRGRRHYRFSRQEFSAWDRARTPKQLKGLLQTTFEIRRNTSNVWQSHTFARRNTANNAGEPVVVCRRASHGPASAEVLARQTGCGRPLRRLGSPRCAGSGLYRIDAKRLRLSSRRQRRMRIAVDHDEVEGSRCVQHSLRHE
jgi:hypothetical protein